MGLRILLLDDEPLIATALRRGLRSFGIEVDSCVVVDDFMRMASSDAYAAFVIDWNLRLCEGTDVCERLRMRGEQRPIALFSSKLDTCHAHQLAEQAGADGYIEKPSKALTFVTELKSLMQKAETRLRTASDSPASFRCAAPGTSVALRFELRAEGVLLTHLLVRLRPKERKLLAVLLQHAGRVHSRDDLARLAWGVRVAPLSTVVETTLSRLRRALGPAGSVIQTVNGGYTIAPWLDK